MAPRASAPVFAPRRPVGPLLAAIAVTLILWSSAFAAIRQAAHDYPPASLALVRFVLASATLAAFAWWRRRDGAGATPPRQTRGERIRVALAGLIGVTIYQAALNAGSRTVPAGVASLLVNTGPIFTAIVATLFLHERLGWRGWTGLVAAFGGGVLVSWGVAGGFRLEGDLGFVVLAAVSQAGYFAVSKPILARHGAFDTACRTIWWGTLFLVPFAPEAWRTIAAAPAAATGAVLYLGVLPGAVGYVTYTYVLSRMSASRAASLLYLVPPLAFAIAWVALGEKPTLISALGGIPILLGVALVNSERAPGQPPGPPQSAPPPGPAEPLRAHGPRA